MHSERLAGASHGYRMIVIGSVAIKTQIGDLQKIEICKLSFCLRGENDKAMPEKTSRARRSRDGRLKAIGSGCLNHSSISALLSMYFFFLPHSRGCTNRASQKPPEHLSVLFRTALCFGDGALVGRR
jgi:hypothetical protein